MPSKDKILLVFKTSKMSLCWEVRSLRRNKFLIALCVFSAFKDLFTLNDI